MAGQGKAEYARVVPAAASELNNLLQIIASTVSVLENMWGCTPGSKKYFEMLRTSVDRAAGITEQLVLQVGGVEQKILLHPALRYLPPMPARPAPNFQVSRCILVIDDESMALELSQHTLSQAGFVVVIANSGQEGLDLFTKDPRRFDLVLLDLSMPGMDGEETFHRLRKVDPQVLVLLNTGFIDRARLDDLLADGMAGFLRRPYRPDEVVKQIHSILANFKNHLPTGISPKY